MTILSTIKDNIKRKLLINEHDAVQDEIMRLHEDIDNLSIKLGKYVKLKHEIEQLLLQQEKS